MNISPLHKKPRLNPPIPLPKLSLHANLPLDMSAYILSFLVKDCLEFLKLSLVKKSWTAPVRSIYYNTFEGSRVYSRNLLRVNSEKFFDFINKYEIKCINIQNATDGHFDILKTCLLTNKVYLINSKLSIEGFKKIKDLPIKTLSMNSQENITEDWLKEGFNCVNELYIYNCSKINERAFEVISCKRDLTRLTISQCGAITNTDMHYLTTLKMLTHLSLNPCCMVTDIGIKALEELNLVGLALYNCKAITNSGLSYLEDKKLTSLTLTNNDHITENGIAFCKNMPLSTVYFEFMRGLGNNALKLLNDSPIVDLTLSYLPIDNRGLEYLSAMPLKILNLYSPFISGKGFNHLKNLALDKLSIQSPFVTNHLSNKDLQHLSQMNIKHLDLRDIKVSDEGLYHLREMGFTHCKRFSLSAVSDAALVALKLISLPHSLTSREAGIGIELFK